MLAFLGAAVPIVASLYVAGSMLVEYTKAAHVARVYSRIMSKIQPEFDALDVAVLGGVEYGRQRAAITARRNTLLKHNGIDPALGTVAAFNRSQAPQAPRQVDLGRQWTLLIGSTIGIILVAIDVATGSP